MERKLVSLLRADDLRFHSLAERGFRRSHDAAYHPACPACDACKALRIKAAIFAPIRPAPPEKTLCAFECGIGDTPRLRTLAALHPYVQGRHADGAMAHMTRADFYAMVHDSPVQTRLIEWREVGRTPVALPA